MKLSFLTLILALILSPLPTSGAVTSAQSYEKDFETLMLTGNYQDFKNYYDNFLKQPVPKTEPEKTGHYAMLTRLCARLGLRDKSKEFLSKIDLNKTVNSDYKRLVDNAYCEEMIQQIHGLETVDINYMFKRPVNIYGQKGISTSEFFRLMGQMEQYINNYADAINTYEAVFAIMDDASVSLAFKAEVMLDYVEIYIVAGQ